MVFFRIVLYQLQLFLLFIKLACGHYIDTTKNGLKQKISAGKPVRMRNDDTYSKIYVTVEVSKPMSVDCSQSRFSDINWDEMGFGRLMLSHETIPSAIGNSAEEICTWWYLYLLTADQEIADTTLGILEKTLFDEAVANIINEYSGFIGDDDYIATSTHEGIIQFEPDALGIYIGDSDTD